jgi:RNA polymerase sigma-70 factor, ECF subfamily
MPRRVPESETARLYDAFGVQLFRYALMILADREEAEDAVQQVFAVVVGRRSGAIEDPERYLRRAVRNTCYSILRQRKRRLPTMDERLLEVRPGAAPALGEDVRLALDAAVRALPAEQREVLHLHAFEGWTFREIAEHTGEPLNTVASRYRYALDKLRITLTDEPHDR